MNKQPDYFTMLMESGFAFDSDGNGGNHLKIYPSSVDDMVDVIRLFLLKDIDNQRYKSGWIDGFRYGNSLTKIEEI